MPRLESLYRNPFTWASVTTGKPTLSRRPPFQHVPVTEDRPLHARMLTQELITAVRALSGIPKSFGHLNSNRGSSESSQSSFLSSTEPGHLSQCLAPQIYSKVITFGTKPISPFTLSPSIQVHPTCLPSLLPCILLAYHKLNVQDHKLNVYFLHRLYLISRGSPHLPRVSPEHIDTSVPAPDT